MNTYQYQKKKVYEFVSEIYGRFFVDEYLSISEKKSLWICIRNLSAIFVDDHLSISETKFVDQHQKFIGDFCRWSLINIRKKVCGSASEIYRRFFVDEYLSISEKKVCGSASEIYGRFFVDDHLSISEKKVYEFVSEIYGRV